MTRSASILTSLCFLSAILLPFSASIPPKTAKHERNESLTECLKNPNTAKKCQAILPFSKSGDIQAFMRPDLNPCDDFYEFACGNWRKVNEARKQATTGFFESLADGMSRKIADILNGTTDPSMTEEGKKVKRFYRSCMKLLEIPIKEHKPKLESIIAEFGTMPALVGVNWNGSDFDWYETLGRIHYKYGVQSIIGLDIMADFKDNSANRIFFGQTQLPLESKSMYLDAATATYRVLYEDKIASQLIKYLQLDEPNAKKVAKSIVDFEKALAVGMFDDGVAPDLDESAKLITPQEMSSKYAPYLNISRYLELALGEPVHESIYDYNEGFQLNLEKVLRSTLKETVANYVYYRLIIEFFPKYAHDEKSQHKICSEVVKSNFAKLLDNMVYRRYNQKGTENDINAVWLKIKETFNQKLSSDELNWMSAAVREEARNKLNSMTLEINSYMDTDFVDEMKDLEIDNYKYYYIDNLRNILRNDVKRKIRKLHEPPTPFEAAEELSYTPVNIVLENKIKIPVSFLQPFYLWSSSYPESLMYGTLGFLIGHELVHGFDDNGRKYDEQGNSREWWDENSTAAFVEKTKCFAEQYHKYVFGGVPLPLSESQAENIADNGGLRLAYDAYLNWLLNNVDRQLPLLQKYSAKQLFFISFAQLWCSDTRPSLRLLQASTDDHTPAKFRVIGVLSNNEEFAKEFECAPKTKMNPDSKCKIY